MNQVNEHCDEEEKAKAKEDEELAEAIRKSKEEEDERVAE